ncbi:MAG TPA: hypothetical protein PKD23_04270 [Bellilinea sp.]|nr:hypothetical protein [Bellilinea sp.]
MGAIPFRQDIPENFDHAGFQFLRSHCVLRAVSGSLDVCPIPVVQPGLVGNAAHRAAAVPAVENARQRKDVRRRVPLRVARHGLHSPEFLRFAIILHADQYRVLSGIKFSAGKITAPRTSGSQPGGRFIGKKSGIEHALEHIAHGVFLEWPWLRYAGMPTLMHFDFLTFGQFEDEFVQAFR